MKLILRLSILILLTNLSFNARCQLIEFKHGNGQLPEKTECISKAQRNEIIQYLNKNVADLTAKGILNTPYSVNTPTVRFIWPLQQTTGNNDPGFFAISNYVDEDRGSSNILDYNCLSRTYDQHAGTDIITWPFPWTKMDNNAVKVVSATAGTIIGKYDGNPDKSCALCSYCNWNAVFIRNSDGSVCWYGHLKLNSLTTKNIGDPVAEGEYLGIVGSAGNSTTPHLHLEVYSDDTFSQLIDPWQGSCNQNGNPSIWKNQQPYYVPSILKIASHSAEPVMPQCYGTEATNFKDNFLLGEDLYLVAYLRDFNPSANYTMTVLKPDNAIFYQTTQSLADYYTVSYWTYYFSIPNDAQTGTYTFKLEFNGQTASHNFLVSAVLPLSLLKFNATEQNGTVQLAWLTTNEKNLQNFELQKGFDGQNFSTISTIAAKGSGNSSSMNDYVYSDKTPNKGLNFYRLKMLDNNGKFSYSDIQKIDLSKLSTGIKLLNNPVNQTLSFSINSNSGIATIKIIDPAGKLLLNENSIIGNNQQMNIPIKNLSAGTYFLVIEINGKHFAQSFIKL